MIQNSMNIFTAGEVASPMLEVVYRAADISGLVSGTNADEFRSEAMCLVDAALFFAEAGSCAEAHTRTNPATGEIELGFAVTSGDATRAEAIIRDALAGTSYDKIAAIIRTAPTNPAEV